MSLVRDQRGRSCLGLFKTLTSLSTSVLVFLTLYSIFARFIIKNHGLALTKEKLDTLVSSLDS
ncbi:MAG: hypothetical protein MHPSP_004305, partial [Paramarteilia canceri]